MDQNIFFRWIWRFNGLALAALLGLGTHTFVVPLFGPAFTTISTIEEDSGATTAGGSDRRLAMANTIDGTDIVVFSYGEQGYTDRKFYPGPKVFNYVFYNAKDGSARWLFPDNKQQVTSFDTVWDDGTASARTPVSIPSPDPVGRKVRALAFDVSRPLGEGIVRYDLYVSRPDGSELTKLIDGADEVSTLTPVGADGIMIANRRGGRTYATTVSLVDFKQTLETELSKQIPK